MFFISDTLYPQRSTGELASYQKKMIRIDDHVGVAIAGLTSDARVLRWVVLSISHGCIIHLLIVMRPQQLYATKGHAIEDALRSTHSRRSDRAKHCRPSSDKHSILWKATLWCWIPRDRTRCTFLHWGQSRPTRTDNTIAIVLQETGPHLFEFSPTGNFYEYHAHSIGARSQSAKTYLEDHATEFEDCKLMISTHATLATLADQFCSLRRDLCLTGTLDELIQHGLNALRDTLQQDKNLTQQNTSIGIIGTNASGKKIPFRSLDDEAVEPYLEEMRRRQGVTTEAEAEPASASSAATADGEGSNNAQSGESSSGATGQTGGDAPTANDGDGDVQMQ